MFFFFFQAEDGIRDLVRSRGLGDVYKRQAYAYEPSATLRTDEFIEVVAGRRVESPSGARVRVCLLYTSDAADDLLCVDLGGRRIIKKKNT